MQWVCILSTRIKAAMDLIEMNDYFFKILNITQRIDTYLGKLPAQGFSREVLHLLTHSMDPEMKPKYYQSLKDIEDINGLKLLVLDQDEVYNIM
jgi:hypothetical protein